MAEEVDELLSFLVSPSPNLRKAAVEIVEGLTGSDDGISKLLTRVLVLLPSLLGLLRDDQIVAKPAVRSLVNLSQNENVAQTLIEAGTIGKIMDNLGKKDSLEVDRLLVMLLVNLTKLEQGARDLLQEKDDKLRGLFVSRLVRSFSRFSGEGEDAYEHVGAVLVNISRVEAGRKLLLDSKRGFLKLILPQSGSKSLLRRRGVIGTLRNCCFEAQRDLPSLLGLPDVWPCLLLPVAGKQVFPEAETAKMPPDLAVPLSMERQAEEDPQVRRESLEAIYMLVMQDAGLKAFWALNGSNILKLGYEDEDDPDVMDKYEQLGSLIIARSGTTD